MPKGKTVGELNGWWALVFKITQILSAILMPLILALLLRWMPWVSRETILNEQFRANEPERREAMQEWSRARFQPRPLQGALILTNPVPVPELVRFSKPLAPRLN